MDKETMLKLICSIAGTDTPKATEKCCTSTCIGKHIAVLQRGWIVVGDVYSYDDQHWIIKNCSTIRRWGTTAGLGELAEKGKLSNTLLDKQSDTITHKLAVVQLIRCNESKWS